MPLFSGQNTSIGCKLVAGLHVELFPAPTN